MTTGLEKYTRGLDDLQEVIGLVGDEQWELQSPCPEWKAIDVVGHLIGGLGMAKSLAMTGKVDAFPGAREAAGSDPKATFAAARAEAEATFTPENLDRLVASPFGEMPLDQFLGVVTLDVITHTWDLGEAIGHEVQLDPELVHESFEGVKPLDQMLRVPGLFGAKVEPPEGADEQTQLLAFLGRPI